MKDHRISRVVLSWPAPRPRVPSACPDSPPRAGELEEIRRHDAGGDPRQGSARRYSCRNTTSEFTELTGIKVGSEQIPEQQQRQKAVIELASGKPSFDVIHVSYHVQKRQFEKAGWLADLSGFMKDPTLTAPDLTESEFSKAGLLYAKNEGPDALAAVLGRLLDPLLEQGPVREEGPLLPKTFDEMVRRPKP